MHVETLDYMFTMFQTTDKSFCFQPSIYSDFKVQNKQGIDKRLIFSPTQYL